MCSFKLSNIPRIFKVIKCFRREENLVCEGTRTLAFLSCLKTPQIFQQTPVPLHSFLKTSSTQPKLFPIPPFTEFEKSKASSALPPFLAPTWLIRYGQHTLSSCSLSYAHSACTLAMGHLCEFISLE